MAPPPISRTNDARSKMPDQTYRARVGEHAFDIASRDGRLLLDGEPVACAFERLSEGSYALLVEGRSYPVVIEETPEGRLRVTLAGRLLEVQLQDERSLLLERFGLNETSTAAQREVRAPMPGLVLRVMAEPGRAVHTGEGLLVLEAMKMENELRAQTDAVVKAVHVAPGDAVGKNALLLEFE